MAFSNSIEYAKLFQAALDEQMLQELTSAWMEANAGMVKYNGGNEIKVPKMSLEGLADYSRESGYDDGTVTLSFETHTFDKDRGKKFRLDTQDVDESNFVASASNVMSVFQKTKVVPEIDAYRYSKIFTVANANLKTGSYTPVVATILGQLKTDIANVQDVIGDNGDLVCVMSVKTAAILDQADKIEKQLIVSDFSNGTVNTKISFLDNVPILRVSSERLKTAYTFGTDGFTGTAVAMGMNWIIISRRAPIGIVKTDMPKIITPDVNQSADAWDIAYRKYHTLIIPDNKVASMFVSYTPIVAPALTATVAKGTGTGNTKFTATAGTGNTLAYKLSSTAVTSNYNDIPTGTTAYTSGADIAATAAQYLAMYELDSKGHVVKFLCEVLDAGDIS